MTRSINHVTPTTSPRQYYAETLRYELIVCARWVRLTTKLRRLYRYGHRKSLLMRETFT
jgi:hypothetical protein